MRYVNYKDFLALALAMSWNGKIDRQLFTGDTVSWQSAVFEMVTEWRLHDKIPELRPLVGSFDRRPGYVPHSELVDDWMDVMMRSDLLNGLDLRNYMMTKSQRTAILRLNEGISSRFGPEIEEMAAILKKYLVL